MALDHFVSQVHLRKFYAKALDYKKMYAFRKADGAHFICGSEDVCRIEQGSTNDFLTEPRALEDFLRKVEPSYDRACGAIASGNFDLDDIVIIAAFAAFIIGTSPTAMRLGASSLTHLLHTQVELADRMGLLELAPDSLGNKTATELLKDGLMKVDTDVKYPQAMGITLIADLTKSFSTFHWEILLNRHSSRFPFLTSDYPTAIEGVGRQIPAIRIVPLKPNLAVRILPQIRPEWRPDLDTDFRYKVRRVSPTEVRTANIAIVRSAESLVFSPVDDDWVRAMVAKNARFRMELEHRRFAKGDGYLHLNSTIVTEAS